MALTRHQRALQKIEAVKARKRLQTAQNEATEGEFGEPGKITSRFSPRVVGVEDPPVVTPARHEADPRDFTEGDFPDASLSRFAACNAKSIDIPAGEKTSGVVGNVTPSSKLTRRFENANEVTPDQSYKRGGVVTNQRGAKNGSRKSSLKKPPKSKPQNSKGRAKTHRALPVDDDSTIESRQYRIAQKSDGIASALDPLFDFLMDEPSIGDDSVSIHSERTDEKGDIVKVVEDFLWEGMNCGKVADCHQDLDSRTLSMDESTVSDGNDTNKKSHRRTKSPNALHQDSSDSRNRVASDEMSILPDVDEMIDDLARATWKVLDESLATTTLDTDRDLTECISFESHGEDKYLCGNIYDMANDFIQLDETTNGCGKIDKVSQIVKDAKRRAEKVNIDFKSDVSFQDSLQTSIKDTSSYASTFFSSIRDGTAFTGAERTVENEDTGLKSVPSGETHTVIQNVDNEVQDEHKADIYAPAEELKSDASFFSKDTDPGNNSASKAFEEAMAKLKDSLDTATASARLQELQASINNIKLVPEDSNWSPQKLYEALSSACNSETDDDDKERRSITEKVKTILSCGPIEADVPFDEMEQRPKREQSLAQKIKNVLTCSDTRPEDAVVMDESQLPSAELTPTLDTRCELTTTPDLSENPISAQNRTSEHVDPHFGTDELVATPDVSGTFASTQDASDMFVRAEAPKDDVIATQGNSSSEDPGHLVATQKNSGSAESDYLVALQRNNDSQETCVGSVGEEIIYPESNPAAEEDDCGSDCAIDSEAMPVKITVVGDTLESHSVETPETTSSTEDEADDAPSAAVQVEETDYLLLHATKDSSATVDIEETESHFMHVIEDCKATDTPVAEHDAHSAPIAIPGPETDFDNQVLEQRTLPEQESIPENESLNEQERIPAEKSIPDEFPLVKKSHKKWSPLRRVVRPLFGKKKKSDEQPLFSVRSSQNTQGSRNMSFDAPDTMSKSTATSPSSASVDVSSSTPNESTSNPFDPSISAKAKREAWRSTRADDFDEIITESARADDWERMFPELSDAVETSTMASF